MKLSITFKLSSTTTCWPEVNRSYVKSAGDLRRSHKISGNIFLVLPFKNENQSLPKLQNCSSNVIINDFSRDAKKHHGKILPEYVLSGVKPLS